MMHMGDDFSLGKNTKSKDIKIDTVEGPYTIKMEHLVESSIRNQVPNYDELAEQETLFDLFEHGRLQPEDL